MSIENFKIPGQTQKNIHLSLYFRFIYKMTVNLKISYKIQSRWVRTPDNKEICKDNITQYRNFSGNFCAITL